LRKTASHFLNWNSLDTYTFGDVLPSRDPI